MSILLIVLYLICEVTLDREIGACEYTQIKIGYQE